MQSGFLLRIGGLGVGGGLGSEEVPVLISDSGLPPNRLLTKPRSQEANSAFPVLLLLFAKEVATTVAPIALGHCSPPPSLPYMYDSGV